MKMPRNRSLRRFRRLMLSRRLWRGRLAFWLGGICIGIVASLFAMAADAAQSAFAWVAGAWFWSPLLICPTIFALTAALTAWLCPGAVGSGIPQAIAVRTVKTPEAQRYLLGPRVLFGKMALTALALLGGASVGREGPTVQVSAAIMLLCASLSGAKRQRGVVVAGAAAGVAAAFNTPIAGIVFAIEELSRSFQHRNSGIVLTTIVLSGAASMSIMGNYSYFGVATSSFDVMRDLWPVVAIGVIGGAGGSLFAWLMVDGVAFIHGLFGRMDVWRKALFAGCCGLFIAVLGLTSGGLTFGTGYGVANDLLHGQAGPSWWFVLEKFVATVLSNVSFIPGGLFSPSLTVGAALGSNLSPWFHATPEQGVILLAMTAYFAGVTQAPITAFVIVLEITGKGVMPAPLIASAVIASTTARLLMPHSLYDRLAHGFIAQVRGLSVPAKDAPPG